MTKTNYLNGEDMKIETLSSIKGIVIDYYGTLVDVGQPFTEIKQWFVKTYANITDNISGMYMAFFKEHARLQCGKVFYLGQDLLMKSYNKSCDKYHIPFFPEKFQRLIIKLFTQPPAYLGSQQAIENLRKYYPVLLLTNADNKILYESIKMQGFKFDYIVSSEDLQCNKPDIKCFQKACELLRMPVKQVLMVGDSLTEDIYGATSFGMQALWINSEKSLEVKSVLQLASVCEIESILLKTR